MSPRRARQNTAHEPTTPSIHRRSSRIGFQRNTSAHPGSSQPTIVTNPIPQNGKRKQPPYDEQSSGKSKRVNITTEDFLATGGRVSVPPEPRTIGPRCFRISGVPPSWSENDLFDVLQTLDPPLTRNEKPSLFPACSGLTQTALLNLDSYPEHLPHAKYLQLPETTSRTGAHLTIDCDFYNLTPLNIPKGEIIAELVA